MRTKLVVLCGPCLALALVFLNVGVQSGLPATGHAGYAGTFTVNGSAEDREGSDTYYGRFVPDPDVDAAARDNVLLQNAGFSLRPGDRLSVRVSSQRAPVPPAVDDAVQPGGWWWILFVLFGATYVLLLARWIGLLAWRALASRRSAPRSAA